MYTFDDADIGKFRKRMQGRRIRAKLFAGASTILLVCSFLFVCAVAIG